MIGAVENNFLKLILNKIAISYLYKQHNTIVFIIKFAFFDYFYLKSFVKRIYSTNSNSRKNFYLISIVKVYDLATDQSLLVKEQKGKVGNYLVVHKSNSNILSLNI